MGLSFYLNLLFVTAKYGPIIYRLYMLWGLYHKITPSALITAKSHQ